MQFAHLALPFISRDDIGLWPDVFNSTLIQFLKENPSKQVRNRDFPRDSCRRKFLVYYYDRHLRNGEKYYREWLFYSITKNTVFCFCCKLFESKQINKFCQGVGDWQHLALCLVKNMKSSAHFNNYKK